MPDESNALLAEVLREIRGTRDDVRAVEMHQVRHDEQLNVVRESIDKLVEHNEATTRRLEEGQRRLDDHEHRLATGETTAAQIRENVKGFEESLNGLGKRINDVSVSHTILDTKLTSTIRGALWVFGLFAGLLATIAIGIGQVLWADHGELAILKFERTQAQKQTPRSNTP